MGTLTDWGLGDLITATAFDTISSNTWKKNGACVLIEQKLGQRLLPLACRYHILELKVEKVFESLIERSSRPNIKLIQRFQELRHNIDASLLKNSKDDEIVQNAFVKSL